VNCLHIEYRSTDYSRHKVVTLAKDNKPSDGNANEHILDVCILLMP
jgi:hypothetical protein